MNSVTAVLLALVLIAVILLIVWLVLRSRSSDLPRGATAYAPGADVGGGHSAGGQAPRGSENRDGATTDMGLAAQEDQRAWDEAAARDEPHARVERDDTPAEDVEPLTEPVSDDAEPVSDDAEPVSDDAKAVAEEYVESGLSELDDESPVFGEEDPLGGPAPRTTAEAFGSAPASGDAAAHEAASRETSVLDEPDVDSTPLFRSIREELLGSGAPEGSGVDEVVAEQDEVDLSWSAERRAWDEQAHAEPEDTDEPEDTEPSGDGTLTEGVVETGAVGAGPHDPAAEEEELLQTSQETEDKTVETSPSGETLEHPPIRRFSGLDEVVDGGFGIGSARPIADGAQPLGHPIKANVDTKTYQDLHSPWYEETEPDVWFLDAGFAERAGFHRAE